MLNKVMTHGTPFVREALERAVESLDTSDIDQLERFIEKELKTAQEQRGYEEPAQEQRGYEEPVYLNSKNSDVKRTKENADEVYLYQKYLDPEDEAARKESERREEARVESTRREEARVESTRREEARVESTRREEELEKNIELIEEILRLLDDH